jgi:hypothetical protein
VLQRAVKEAARTIRLTEDRGPLPDAPTKSLLPGGQSGLQFHLRRYCGSGPQSLPIGGAPHKRVFGRLPLQHWKRKNGHSRSSQHPRGATRSRHAAVLVGKIPQDAKPASKERVDEIFYDLSFGRIMVPDSNASPYQWPPLVVGPHNHRRATSLVRLMPEAFSRLRRLMMVEYLTDDEPENRNCHKICNAIARGWIASSNRRSR